MRNICDPFLPWENPSDAATFFETIVFHPVPVPANVATLVVPPNPNRVFVSIGSALPDVISIYPDVSGADALDAIAQAGGSGLFFGNTFTWASDGPFCQLGFKVRTNAPDTAFWFEQQLTRWPVNVPRDIQQIKVPKCPSLLVR